MVVVCRLMLAAVFALAAGTKLADRSATRVAVVGFGVRESLATPAMWGLIAGELLTVVLLLPTGTAWFGALSAVGLLGVFSAAAGLNLARGKAPECNCFGQLHSEPVGPRLLVRNAGFAIPAVVIVAVGRDGVGPGVGVLFGSLSEVEAMLGGLVVVLATAVVVLAFKLRSVVGIQAGLVESVERVGRHDAAPARDYPPGLAVGMAAPMFTLPSAAGPVSLSGLLEGGRPVLVVFVSPRCSACHAVVPAIKEWRERHGSTLNFAVVTSGDRAANAEQEARADGEPLLFEGDATSRAFKVAATPGAIVVAADGTVGSEMKYGMEQITALLLGTVGEPAVIDEALPMMETGRGLPIGSVAPVFQLESAAGPVSFPELPGDDRPLFLLFTSPECVDCRDAVAKIHRWREIHGERVNFAVMTTGDRLNLDAGVYEARTTVGAFNVGEVPAAVLIGADGTVLVETVFGLEAIVVLFLGEVASAPQAPAPSASALSGDAGPVAPPLGEAATLAAYLGWHAAILTALNGPGPAVSGGLEALVWSPRAGLGDSLFGFAGWFRLAMRSGRLFFVDLDGGDDHTWRIGLTSPSLSWDWADARAVSDPSRCHRRAGLGSPLAR